MQQRSQSSIAVALAGTLALLGLAPQLAEASELSVAGSAIAAAQCGPCHAVGATDTSPHKITPPLRTLAADFPIPMLVEALKTGVVSGHDEMPMFDLGTEGVRALVAYIDSLNPKGPQYLAEKP